MRLGIALFSAALAGLACNPSASAPLIAPAAMPQPASLTELSVSLDRVGCSDADLELLIPFYEGVTLGSPARFLEEIGQETIELVYPAPLSLPAAGFRCRGREWNMIGATLDDAPVVVRLREHDGSVVLSVSCVRACQLKGWSSAGDFAALARSMGAVYDRAAPKPALAASEIRFFVQQWVADDDPALRSDWSVEQLSTELEATPADAIAFVYGWDPAGVDLGGRYFWSDGAEQRVRELVSESPGVRHLAWLNMRTYKHSIPRLGLTHPMPPELENATWRGDSGTHAIRQYAFEAVEMCLCTESWQSSRRVELERLAELGFDVVQLDEFPVAPRWHPEPCLGKSHAHPPGDFGAEWTCSLQFLRELAKRADELGVVLTSEEPSGALLGLTRGYIDRQANQEPDMYGFWTQSRHARTVPLFSTAFGDRISAYTDVDPTGPVPRSVIPMRKLSPSD